MLVLPKLLLYTDVQLLVTSICIYLELLYQSNSFMDFYIQVILVFLRSLAADHLPLDEICKLQGLVKLTNKIVKSIGY